MRVLARDLRRMDRQEYGEIREAIWAAAIHAQLAQHLPAAILPPRTECEIIQLPPSKSNSAFALRHAGPPARTFYAPSPDKPYVLVTEMAPNGEAITRIYSNQHIQI